MADATDERHDRERLAGGAFVIGGDRVSGHDEREERFRRRTLERAERECRCCHHRGGRHGATPALVERDGRHDEDGGREEIRLADPRAGVARHPQVQLRVHQRGGSEQTVPDADVDPGESLPSGGLFVPPLNGIPRRPRRRHPAGGPSVPAGPRPNESHEGSRSGDQAASFTQSKGHNESMASASGPPPDCGNDSR